MSLRYGKPNQLNEEVGQQLLRDGSRCNKDRRPTIFPFLSVPRRVEKEKNARTAQPYFGQLSNNICHAVCNNTVSARRVPVVSTLSDPLSFMLFTVTVSCQTHPMHEHDGHAYQRPKEYSISHSNKYSLHFHQSKSVTCCRQFSCVAQRTIPVYIIVYRSRPM